MSDNEDYAEMAEFCRLDGESEMMEQEDQEEEERNPSSADTVLISDNSQDSQDGDRYEQPVIDFEMMMVMEENEQTPSDSSCWLASIQAGVNTLRT